ncbi:MAG: hypothetical protein J4400_01825 [Candidatus Aenigmarchaeota archaeon]|nr:hypothetical protein [Candidatus Aenigmarchaeota archaeon]
MKGDILSATDAAAYGAKSACVQSVPHFPAPLSVEIARKLSKIHSCKIFDLESAGGAFAAAIGSATGMRTFVPCSSPLAYEVLAAPFMRLPFVAVNVSRSLHGLKPDNSAVMALRDAGYLMFFPESNQEIHDTVVLAYRIGEDSKVMLPSIVNIDGLPSLMEPVQIATEQSVKSFLPKFNAPKLVSGKLSFDIYSDKYDEQKLQQNKAMENAADLINKAGEKWKQKFHRFHGLVDRYMTEDAETIIVTMGYHSATAKAVAKKLREQGKKVGVLRIRVFRPWPKAAVEAVLQNVKKIVVFEQAISVGIGGILRAHIGKGSQLICLGKYPSEKDFIDAVTRVEKSEKDLRLWL